MAAEVRVNESPVPIAAAKPVKLEVDYSIVIAIIVRGESLFSLACPKPESVTPLRRLPPSGPISVRF